MDISKITVNFHSSIRVDAGKILYFDPFKITEGVNDADYIFITHDHYDHFSVVDIKKLANADTIYVVTENMERKVRANIDSNRIFLVKQAEQYDIEGLKFETVAAYNKLKPFHSRKDGWCGYIVDVDGERVYVAGDTDFTKEASDVKCDVAVVPIGGTYTMNSKDAAKLINKIKPKVAIPVHYGGIIGTIGDADKFMGLVDEDIKVEVKIK